MAKSTKGEFDSKEGLYGLFNDSFPPILDGVTLTVQNYARFLAEKGMTPCVVTPWNPEYSSYPYEVMRYFSLPIANRKPYRYGYPKVDPFIWKRLRSTPFKLVHAHCPFSSGRLGVYVKKKQNVPLIGTFHSKYKQDLEHSFRHFPWCVPIIMKRILAFFNACDEVWIPQGYVEETVREYGYRGPLTVVENGNDFASIYKGDLSEVKRNAKKELGVKEDEISLLFVGQHIKEKGVDIILKTLKQLSGNVKFKMNFIGNGYYSGEMQEFIRHEGLDDKVTMHGIITDREELAKHYAAADLFLFPSFYDNAPLVVREAAALGTPSILLKGSTAAEVVQNGKNGFLVNRTPHEFASLITYLAQNRDEIGEVAAGARFSLVRSWEDVLEEVSERYKVIIDKYGRK